MDCNGDCMEPDNFYPMTAFDETGIVGHLILRFTDEEKKVLRFGFVIVDDSKRGMGYGKGMLRLALQFAFDIFKADKVTLGVLENNPGAYYCYKAAGFRDVTGEEPEYYILMGKKIKCLELEITK
jgi:RimJ/RimL family protein N-acetyltransferase